MGQNGFERKNMNENTDIIQWKIRHAVQRLHKKYHKHPWIFMTEADIQCALYSELIKSASKPKKTITRDVNGEKMRDWEYQIPTMSLHSELSSSRRKAREFVDLCLIAPPKVEFWIKKTKFSRKNNEIPVWNWNWNPEDSIGLEIKFNRWILKTNAYSYGTKRERVTKKWKNYRSTLIRDIKKLKKYHRGWLIFVDQHSLISTYKGWRKFIDEIIRDSNYGYAKKTLNAYYLCPKLKRALSYKSPHKAF
jgi:hypothetical protein